MSLSSLHPTTTFHNVEEPPVLKPTLIPRSVQYWLISRLAAQRHAAICHTSPHESVNKDRLYIGLYARGGDSVMSGGEDKSVHKSQSIHSSILSHLHVPTHS